MKKLFTCVLSILVILLLSSVAVAKGSKGPKGSYKTGLVASSGGSVEVGDVKSTGTGFIIESGSAHINSVGQLFVHFDGLLRDGVFDTTAEEYFASVVCGGAVVYSTDPVPGDGFGGAMIKEDTGITSCSNPAILIRRNGCTIASGCGADDASNTRWLGITGF